ncbi:hypothetical protein GCM10011532_02890 [Christiangramia forsetii]|nr:hypothetical protein GCM10011532_02890 [Christiangramia forsetii]
MAYQSYLKRNPVEKSVDQEEKFVDQVETIIQEEPESEFLGNQLNNGESPYNSIYGEPEIEVNDNTLTIKNQSMTDVVVMLMRVRDNRIVRNHYIKGKSQYVIKNIPDATYYSKFYHGNNWNPTRVIKSRPAGGFDNDETFIDSDEDIMKFEVYEDGNYVYSSQFEITLETQIVEGKAMREKEIAASDFF